MYQKYFKRLLDILCALAAVIVFGWLYIILAILVRIKLGSPVLFTQDRPGKGVFAFHSQFLDDLATGRAGSGSLGNDARVGILVAHSLSLLFHLPESQMLDVFSFA